MIYYFFQVQFKKYCLILVCPVDTVIKLLKDSLTTSCRAFERGQMKSRTIILISEKKKWLDLADVINHQPTRVIS